MKLKPQHPAARYLLEKEFIKYYSGELPQSKFQFSNHLKWEEQDTNDFLSPTKAFSKVLEVYWEVDLDQDMRLALYLNGMRVGQLTYGYPSIPRTIAEQCEDAMRKDITAYLRMLEILELSNELNES